MPENSMRYAGASRTTVDYLQLAREVYESAKIEADALQRRSRRLAARTVWQSRKKFSAFKKRSLARSEATARLALLEELSAARMANYDAQRAELIDLSLTIARKIIGAELSASSHALAQRLATQLQRQVASNHTSIHLSPADYERLRQEPTFAAVKLLATDLAPGEAVVVTANGKITIRIIDSLEPLEQFLRNTPGRDHP